MKGKVLSLLIAILAGLCFAHPVAAQKGSYLSIGGGLGMSGHQYKLGNGVSDASRSSRLGWHANAGFGYFFTPNWGLGTGISLAGYQTIGKFGSYQNSFAGQVDDEGDGYTKIVDLTGWRERQKSLLTEVPLLVYYQKRLGQRQRHGIYAAAGAKVQFDMRSRYKVTDGTVTQSGYYPEWNVLLYGLPQHGFGTEEWLPSGDFSIRTGWAATGQLGAVFGLTDCIDLLVGVYLDYGLNNVKKGNGNPLVSLNAGEPYYTDMITSEQTGRTNLVSVGGTVTLRFRLCCRKQESKPAKPEPVIPEIVPTKKNTDTVPEKPEPVAEQPEPVTETIPETVPVPVSTNTGKLPNHVFFKFNEAVLSHEAKIVLDSVATIMQANPDMTLTIEGHTCNIGTKEVNIRLGEARARSARDYLIGKGIAPGRLNPVSKYYLEPLMPNDTPQHRAMNRRAEFVENKREE